MTKSCRLCTTSFEITEDDLKFYDKVSPVFRGKKYQIPPPTLCPECREQRRLAFRNERSLYNGTCSLCRKNVVSVYAPDKKGHVYCLLCWWSDKWDPKEYGLNFDFKRPFFEQYGNLLENVPKLAMMNDNGTGSENCEYTYDISHSKNAYLVVGSWFMQDCMYGLQINHVKDCVDNCFVNESNLMYNCLFCERCYQCQDCVQCAESRDCIFGFDLKDCRDCLFSAGLRHKQYYIWNQPCTKEEYLKKKELFGLGIWKKRETYRSEFLHFILKTPRRFAYLLNCENCTGDNIVHSKDAKECYSHRNLHTCKWMTNGDGAKDCYECYSTGGPELCYDCITPDNSYSAIFTVFCWKSQSILYSDNCHSSHNLFGCIGLKHAQYCILNKQYTKEEYETLVPKIIEHMVKTPLTPPLTREDTGGCEWGEFFDPKLSPFGYNETVAQEYFPLTKEEALKKGFNWSDYVPPPPNVEKILTKEQMKKLPDTIKDISDDILNWALTCEVTGKPFKIIKPELKFYREHNLPIPRRHPDQRHRDRMALRNPRKLWKRTCMKCNKEIQTTYSPERPEIVYCEACYLKEVY